MGAGTQTESGNCTKSQHQIMVASPKSCKKMVKVYNWGCEKKTTLYLHHYPYSCVCLYHWFFKFWAGSSQICLSIEMVTTYALDSEFSGIEILVQWNALLELWKCYKGVITKKKKSSLSQQKWGVIMPIWRFLVSGSQIIHVCHYYFTI